MFKNNSIKKICCTSIDLSCLVVFILLALIERTDNRVCHSCKHPLNIEVLIVFNSKRIGHWNSCEVDLIFKIVLRIL